MMISVIVPVYNTGPSLAGCIDSILASAYKDFEVILVNDGSTDGSPAICREYCRKDPRVRLIDQENRGVSAARNTGIGSSRGEWVVFVDSDDFISPDFFQMAAEAEPADLLIFDFMRPGRETVEGVRAQHIPLDSGEDRAALVERLLRFRQLAEDGYTNLCSVCGKVYRKSVLEGLSAGFPLDVLVGEDILFNTEFYLAMRSCVYIPVPVYRYVVRIGSATHSFVPGLLQNYSVFQRELGRLLTAHGMFPRLEEAYAAKTLENLAYILIKGTFNPYSPLSAGENRAQCRQMREDEIYAAALKYNLKIGNLPRRVMLAFFQLRCYWMVKLICRVCYFCIELLDKRKEKR